MLWLGAALALCVALGAAAVFGFMRAGILAFQRLEL
jgi:hypothetical protein